jgi:hypothetical protein
MTVPLTTVVVIFIVMVILIVIIMLEIVPAKLLALQAKATLLPATYRTGGWMDPRSDPDRVTKLSLLPSDIEPQQSM